MAQAWAGEERRKNIRYPCGGEVLVRQRGGDVSLEAQLSDISLGGCYLDMMNPLPSEAEIELTIRVGQRQVRGGGRVRASRLGFGMGVAFTDIGAEDQAKLQELINWLAGSFPQAPTENAERPSVSGGSALIDSEGTPMCSNLDVPSALDALLLLLERKGVIDHDEYAEIAKKIGIGLLSRMH